MYKLNYGSKTQSKMLLDISVFEYSEKESIFNHIADDILAVDDDETIYVFTYENYMNDNDDILVFRNKEFFYNFVLTMIGEDGFRKSKYKSFSGYNFFLFECESWEEAYKMCVDLREESPLCYGKN